MNEVLNEKLKDIRNVNIDITRPVVDRIVSLYEQISNPYRFKYKNITISIEYTGSASIEEIILA